MSKKDMDNNPNQRTYFFTSERIKKERLDMGLTLKQLSDLSGISKSSLQRYENGSCEIRMNVITTLAKTFGVSTNYLLGVESKDFTLTELSYLSDLFRSFGYSLKYDHKFNEYTIKNLSTNDSMNISEELLDKLKSEVLSFMRFKVTELFNGRFQDSP
jgi:hypothetical protein